MNLNECIFGKWQYKSIDPVVNFLVPGLYFLSAKTYGAKGFLGGTHSWLTHVSADLRHTVFEVTTIETIHVQGSGFYYGFNGIPNYAANIQEQRVFVSNRNGGQLWFGNIPKIVYLGPQNFDELLAWTELYPNLKLQFKILSVNCNTFTSWILHNRGNYFWTGIGAKNWAKLAK